MVNIAEILKDCPKGTKLYSPICGDCRLIKIYDGLGFDVINDTDDVFNFSYDGRYHLNGECCIFPSNENRDWNTFQKPFKDGDIIYVKTKCSYDTGLVSIYKKEDSQLFYSHCAIGLDSGFFYQSNIFGLVQKNKIDIIRFASEIEKDKLFDAIKKNGYKWNLKTKTLDKLIEPTFKVGDRIRHKDDRTVRTINYIYYESYGLTDGHILLFKEQDQYELVPNKFDINTLKPFESKVLVRDVDHHEWEAAIFGRYNGEKVFVIGGNDWYQCIPFEGNEHLYGTTNDCDKFYKNW